MKNGKFVGQYTRLMTTEEKQKFMDILNAAFSEMGVKVKSIEVSADGSHNSYYGHSSTTFTVTLPQTIAFRKGRDTVYKLTNIKFMVQPELGFNTYEDAKKLNEADPAIIGDYVGWDVDVYMNDSEDFYKQFHYKTFENDLGGPEFPGSDYLGIYPEHEYAKEERIFLYEMFQSIHQLFYF